MQNDQNHHRRSIRLKDYNYSQSGAYYFTIVTHQREHIFGDIVDDEMRLNPLGEIVCDEWLKTPSIRSEIELGEFIVMPNHFHAIVIINESDVGAYGHTPLHDDPNTRQWVDQHTPLHPQTNGFRSPSRTFGALVRGFKGAVTKRINEMRATPGVPVWQRNYFEHIITSEKDYDNTEAYIVNNPLNRNTDNEYS
jgi:REP element-mobilizing transposase RayT